MIDPFHCLQMGGNSKTFDCLTLSIQNLTYVYFFSSFFQCFGRIATTCNHQSKKATVIQDRLSKAILKGPRDFLWPFEKQHDKAAADRSCQSYGTTVSKPLVRVVALLGCPNTNLLRTSRGLFGA